MSKETTFETDIRSKVEQIARKCRAEGIPFLMAFDVSGEGDKEPTITIAVSIPKGSSAPLLAAYGPLRPQSDETTITTRGGRVAAVSTPE